jgi:hypothetical protein
MDLNFEIYKGKSFSGLCKDIVKNSENKKDQIDIVVSELRGLIKTINDAVIIVPLIKDYYEMYGREWKHLVSKVIDTNCLAKGVKYEIPYSQDMSLIEYQYRVLNERRKGVKTNLTSLGKEYSIEHDYETLHDALNDLHLNIKVWNRLKFQIAV